MSATLVVTCRTQSKAKSCDDWVILMTRREQRKYESLQAGLSLCLIHLVEGPSRKTEFTFESSPLSTLHGKMSLGVTYYRLYFLGNQWVGTSAGDWVVLLMVKVTPLWWIMPAFGEVDMSTHMPKGRTFCEGRVGTPIVCWADQHQHILYST